MKDINRYGIFAAVDIQVEITNFKDGWSKLLVDQLWLFEQHLPERHEVRYMVHGSPYSLTSGPVFIGKLVDVFEAHGLDWRVRHWQLLNVEGLRRPDRRGRGEVTDGLFGVWLHLTKFGIEDI